MKSGVIYRGPSLIDGAPIVCVAIYSNRNRKTGAMLQTYIIRSDINPLEASKTGADVSICGTCPMRGDVTSDPARKIAANRKCYVNLGQGPLAVFRGLLRGIYPETTRPQDIEALGAGRMVRVGTYGDPAAVPGHVWDSLLKHASSWTAYTHQKPWRPDLAMQSADTLAEAREHWTAGRRTFRVVDSVDDIQAGQEILCPASKEAGARVQCAACGLCKGSARGKSIAIPLH